MTPSTLPPSPVTPIPYDPSFEKLEPDEDATHAEFVRTFLEIGDTTWKDTGRGLRAVHAKAHGLLRGTLTVPVLPAPYAQGLFARPASHVAIARISTSPGDLLDDRVSTPRGIALKVLGVGDDFGPRLPGSEGRRTQDFLMTDGKVFLAPTGKKFLSSLKLLAATTDRLPRLKQAFSTVLRGAETALEAVGGESATLKGLGGHPTTHPLGATFYSGVPFRYGVHMAKFSIAPVSPNLVALRDLKLDLHDAPDGLRAAVAATIAAGGGAWEFRVQLCTDLESMPIEDATVEWPEDRSPYVAVARLEVPPQASWTEQKATELDDGLAFSVWHGLEAHRPLGSVNRARRWAYPASADARSPRGRCPIHEPAG